MDLKLVPENGYATRNGNETLISRKVKESPGNKNPWHGKFDRRKTPRDAAIVYSVPLAANAGNFGKPDSE